MACMSPFWIFHFRQARMYRVAIVQKLIPCLTGNHNGGYETGNFTSYSDVTLGFSPVMLLDSEMLRGHNIVAIMYDIRDQINFRLKAFIFALPRLL